MTKFPEGPPGSGSEKLPQREKPSFCSTGKRLMEDYGPASKQFAAHVKLCNQCAKALSIEQPRRIN